MSTIVEVKTSPGFDQTENLFYVRRKEPEMNDTMHQLFGYDIKKVRELSKENFEAFMKVKEEFEKFVIQKFACIVTTVGTAGSHTMVQRKFKRVVMDEATMIKEHEFFLATQHAEQIVLVGD